MFALTVSYCKPASQFKELFGFCGASTGVDEGTWISKKKVFQLLDGNSIHSEKQKFVLHSSTKSGQNQSNKLRYEEIRSVGSCLTNE
jgi:hypothetical protein